jgi:hypothetical protein
MRKRKTRCKGIKRLRMSAKRYSKQLVKLFSDDRQQRMILASLLRLTSFIVLVSLIICMFAHALEIVWKLMKFSVKAAQVRPERWLPT